MKRCNGEREAERSEWQKSKRRKKVKMEPLTVCNPIIPGSQAGCNCSLVPVSTRRPVTAAKPQSAGETRSRVQLPDLRSGGSEPPSEHHRSHTHTHVQAYQHAHAPSAGCHLSYLLSHVKSTQIRGVDTSEPGGGRRGEERSV